MEKTGKIRNKTRMDVHALILLNAVLEVLATTVRQMKELKGTHIGEEEVKVHL